MTSRKALVLGEAVLPYGTLRTKHIAIYHHFIYKRILRRKINFNYINTNGQSSIILTKLLIRLKFETHRQA
uniref:Uncharacterized protein n=1 Tax=Physcomitrium patens TaxID=3218 RepID=A0A2K1JGR4_PHYPA|nr:hypothetical protein PHYPA_018121 [Physcomitrium patens]